MTSFSRGIALALQLGAAASFGPHDFRGRIAWSGDGNHNDPYDWIASPVALTIFAEAGVKDRLVHFDYNSILSQTDPEWERTSDSITYSSTPCPRAGRFSR